MTAPKRIQRKRTKSWRKPPGTVCVSRPSVFGNPFHTKVFGHRRAVSLYRGWMKKRISQPRMAKIMADAYGLKSTETFFSLAVLSAQRSKAISRLAELRGKNLACYCKPGEPCHADVLLELANG